MSTGGERKNGLLSLRRRNTFSGGTSGGWKGRRKRKDSEEEEKRLSCVLEDISACGSSSSCSQLVGYRREEKVFPVQYKTEYSGRKGREAKEEDNNRVRNEAALKDKRSFTKSTSSCSNSSTTAAIMAWRASRCGSPSTYETLQHNAAPPTTSSSTSWIDSLRLLTDKGAKKKGNGLFGTLRGRSSRDKARRNSSESVATTSGGTATGPPRSPLLLGRHLNNTPSSSHPELGSSNHHKSGSIKTQKLYIGNNSKHSRDLQGRNSTGFQTMDSTDSHDLESSLSPLSLSLSYRANEFGSCHELSYEHNPSSVEDRNMSAIRKSTSLPRTVLCSPVHTRRNKGERPTSHWLMRDIFDPTVSPSSSPPCTFSTNGSSDTLQNDTTTPKDTDEWRFQQQLEPVLKTGLTRSTSMPFESGAEIVKDKSVPLRKKAVIKDGLIKERSAGGSVAVEGGKGISTRLTMRSQSFNAHFSVHAQETVIMREHIVRFLLETENSYIHSLRTLSKDYHSVLSSIDCHSLKEVLPLASQLALWHEDFATLVKERLDSWQEEPSIGDVLVDTFSQDQFMKMYSSYIEHYSQARSSLEAAKLNKPSLCKTLEDLSRENHGKLSVEDLLIKPVQRIPRYLLFVKDLIKQTHTGHHDYSVLQQAQSQLSMVANHVNEYERQSGLLHLHKELLNTVEGLSDVLTESSSLLRCDQITEIRGAAQKKDRLLLLFSDRLVCASTRRRSTGFRKGSLMNVNSLQNDLLKYRIKWLGPSTAVTINQCHTPLIERRKYNTLEKTLHNLLEDEAILLQMISSTSSLHSPHQPLNAVLQEMLGSLRDVMSAKRQEMDNLQLPHERARVDITIHNSSPPNKVSITFSSQKDRQDWEHTLHSLQLSLPKQQDPTSTSSTHHQRTHTDPPNTALPQFMWHVTLPSCRVGSELSSIAVPNGMYNQLFVCINDVCGRGNVAILNSWNTSKDTPPQLVATLPLSSSRLICSLCVEHKNITLANAPSFPDNSRSSTRLPLTPPTAPPTDRAPLEPDELLCPSPQSITDRSHPSTPPSSHRTSSYIVSPTQKDSRHKLAPPTPEGNQWLWLGTEDGILHVLKVGVASLHVSSSLSIDIGAAVLCIHSDEDYVWVGLSSGRIALFNLHKSIDRPERFISVSSYPIKAIVSVGACKLVATGNRIVGVNSETLTCKELVSLSDQIDQLIIPPSLPIVQPSTSSVTQSKRTPSPKSSSPTPTTSSSSNATSPAAGLVFISLKNSLTVHICSFNGAVMETVHTVDCSSSVTSALRYYDPIIKKHKCTNPYITSLICTQSQLLIGTSTGVLITLSLVGRANTHQLHPLIRGHVDRVSTLVSVPPTHSNSNYQVFISGGHGLEDINKARACDDVSETEGCLLFWYLSSTKNQQLH